MPCLNPTKNPVFGLVNPLLSFLYRKSNTAYGSGVFSVKVLDIWLYDGL